MLHGIFWKQLNGIQILTRNIIRNAWRKVEYAMDIDIVSAMANG